MPSDDRSATRRLARAARPLKPERAPYYVSNPSPRRGERFGPGWYWTPDGAAGPQYLAYNADAALIALHLADQDQADEPATVIALARIAA